MDFTELGTPQIICLDGGTARMGAMAACISTTRGRVTCGSAKECRGAALDEGRFGGYTVSIPLVLNRIRANSCGD